MKKYLLIAIAAFLSQMAFAQYDGDYRIIFQVTTSDTIAHKALMKQLKNMNTVAPQTEIQIVCHGPGLSMLVAEQSVVTQQMQYFINQGVIFSACAFSMNERNVSKNEIIEGVGYVQAGILEIVSKQQEGWFYIKAGF
jgi:intracellular sulfur oxidation DsrE/DsrF family protein